MTDNADLEIAVIGMACRFPGADTVEAFWRNLRGGVESLSFFSDAELLESGVSGEMLNDPAYVKAAAILGDVERFDARFFGCTAREAQALDPQQRLFLETSWEALERAGYDPERYPGSIGVFGGVSGSAWFFALMADPRAREAISPYDAMLSTEKDFLAPRVAYKLNLSGPAVVVQTACSTSLVAVHLACQSLLAGECDMALAGGVSISVPQKVGYLHEPDGILSRDGHCRSFDESASGTMKGSGAGLVLLKRLADALSEGDQIEAVIKGSAVNNDGARKVGFTAPGVDGQAGVIRAALATARVGPGDITYVETHGTATALGDPIEVAALNQVFRAETERRGYCAIGSVKTNIGHLDAAAGVAGLIKAALMLKHRELVPSLHFTKPNPRIDFDGSPFYVGTKQAPWESDGRLRRAGVSSFGIGGTNVHIILEEAPRPSREAKAARREVLVLSARSGSALERATDALGAHLLENPGLPLGDVAFTLGVGRRPFKHRRAVVCRDLAEAERALAGRDPQRTWAAVADEGRPVAFLISGQGAQYVNMARGLYDSEPEFRDEVDDCCHRLRSQLGLDLRGLLYPSEAEAAVAAERLNETRFTQPALFVVEYALARLWISWGVVPEAMIGHSIGEYVAASLAGVLGRDDALAVIAERARLVQECPRGAMTGVALPAEAVRPRLAGRLDVCVVNGPEACVVGGPLEDVELLEARLTREGAAFGRVPVSHAFHSALMDPALVPFGRRLADVRLQRPRIPFVSNLTGTWITDEQATDPGYWVRHMRGTVQFSEGLRTLMEKPQRALVEVGPGRTLVALARRRSPAWLALPSLRHQREAEPDEALFLQTAARLWTAGVGVDWSRRQRGRSPRRVTLPTYPFERERYGIGPARPRASTFSTPAGKLPVERWLYGATWRRSEPVSGEADVVRGRWCVFADPGGLGDDVVAGLRERGAQVTVVRLGRSFEWAEPDVGVVGPSRGDYERLFGELQSRGGVPDRFVHLWGLGGRGEEAIDRGLLGVLRLGEALGRWRSQEASLTVVMSGTQDLLGTEPLSPLRAAMLGPCRVIPQEYPLITCRTVDVIAPTASTTGPIGEQILAEITSRAAEPAVAYRGRYRWVQSFESIPPAESARERVPLRPRGVYLVTGGLGKVGQALSAHLARTVGARLVLTGRSGLPDRAEWDERLARGPRGDEVALRIGAVRSLEKLGAEVLVVGADVADIHGMREAFLLARERFGRLDGVIHAAGDLGAGVVRPLAETEAGDCERQLRPKLGGAEVIDALLGNERLDFVLLASSLSTVLGGLGFAAYSAANHALDTFARVQHQNGKGFWMSACWDAWQFRPDRVAGGRKLFEAAITPEEGGAAFGRLLALSQRPQVIVSTTPLEERVNQWMRLTVPELPEDEAATEQPDRHPRPEIGAVYVEPEDPVERRLAALWAEALGVDRVGMDDNFFELGGSSLTAVHLMGRLRKEFAVQLSVAALFEAPTVRILSGLIRSGGASEPALARSADRGESRMEARKRQRRTSDAAVE